MITVDELIELFSNSLIPEGVQTVDGLVEKVAIYTYDSQACYRFIRTVADDPGEKNTLYTISNTQAVLIWFDGPHVMRAAYCIISDKNLESDHEINMNKYKFDDDLAFVGHDEQSNTLVVVRPIL
jgi:hypothetical protein